MGSDMSGLAIEQCVWTQGGTLKSNWPLNCPFPVALVFFLSIKGISELQYIDNAFTL